MGGNALKGVGAIHKSEAGDTAYTAKRDIKPLRSVMLGSFKTKEFSGDIDIGVLEDSNTIFERAVKAYGCDNVRKCGSVVSTKIPIVKYKGSLVTDKVRTGFVQVDYISGNDLNWLKLFYHSPADSKLKGTHRNIALSTVAEFTENVHSKSFDSFGRSVSEMRYKWSPTDGLVKVRRRSVWNERNNRWNKTRKEELISDSEYDAKSITITLFNSEDVSILDSAESVINGVKVYIGMHLQEVIFEKMALNFSKHNDIGNKEWDYPDEIKRNLPTK